MEIPEISFSNWMKWFERSTSKCINNPGVYILAHFNKEPPVEKTNLVQEVIYIGITGRYTRNSKESSKPTLKKRLDTFNEVALKKTKNNHAGGKEYRKKFPNKNGDDLYVAVFPVEIPNKILLSTYIQFIERKLIYEYVNSWTDLPACNSE